MAHGSWAWVRRNPLAPLGCAAVLPDVLSIGLAALAAG